MYVGVSDYFQSLGFSVVNRKCLNEVFMLTF